MCMLSCFSHVQLFVTLWTVACQAPLPKEFSRQEYWSEKKKKKSTGVLPCPSSRDIPDCVFPAAPALQADSLPLSHHGSPMHT